jgi:hypothetical protein
MIFPNITPLILVNTIFDSNPTVYFAIITITLLVTNTKFYLPHYFFNKYLNNVIDSENSFTCNKASEISQAILNELKELNSIY